MKITKPKTHKISIKLLLQIILNKNYSPPILINQFYSKPLTLKNYTLSLNPFTLTYSITYSHPYQQTKQTLSLSSNYPIKILN